jgi:hypothetical protein
MIFTAMEGYNTQLDVVTLAGTTAKELQEMVLQV